VVHPERIPTGPAKLLILEPVALFRVNADLPCVRVSRSVVCTLLNCGNVPVCIDPYVLVASLPLTTR
jgi:hypothetical protein